MDYNALIRNYQSAMEVRQVDEHEHRLRLQALQNSVDKLHRHMEGELFKLARKVDKMALTLDDILAKQATVVAASQKNTDATAAVGMRIDGLKQTILDLKAQLEAAGQDAGKLQQVADNMDAVAASIDADTEAEKALANTDAGPTPSTNP